MKDDLDFSKEFISLHNIDNENENYVEDDDDDVEALKKIKDSKKKKKKKKRKLRSFNEDKMDLLMEDIELSTNEFGKLTGDIEEDYIIKKKGKKGKKTDLFNVKQARKQKKKNLEAKFNPELVLLRKALKDADLAVDDIKEVLANIKGSKARYVGKTLTDLFQALNSANSTRAGIIRDMTNIKKTIADLSMKQDKLMPKKKNEDEADKEEFGINLFGQIFGGGSRKELMEQANDYFNAKNAQESSIGLGGDELVDSDSSELDDIINSRLEEEGNPYREEEGTNYIKYEQLQPEDCVVYHDSDNWDMDAIDRDGDSMPEDYPRLNKEDLGKMTFNFEDGIASDAHGRRFRIIQK